MRRARLAPLLFCAILLLPGCGWLNRKLMYVPYRELPADPGRLGLGFEDVAVRAADGPIIHGWYVPLASTSPVILFCHGNGGDIATRLDKLRRLRAAGASVLLFDYRGYGRSTGVPTEQGTYADAEAMYAWLVDVKKVPPERIVFQGESLGAGVATELAVRHKAAGLIFESGFTSALDMGRRLFPHLPVKLLLVYRYDNASKIGRVDAPILVLHSPQDDIVPFEMGRAVFAAAREPKRFVELTGDHNRGYALAGRVYIDAVAAFLKETEHDRVVAH